MASTCGGKYCYVNQSGRHWYLTPGSHSFAYRNSTVVYGTCRIRHMEQNCVNLNRPHRQVIMPAHQQLSQFTVFGKYIHQAACEHNAAVSYIGRVLTTKGEHLIQPDEQYHVRAKRHLILYARDLAFRMKGVTPLNANGVLARKYSRMDKIEQVFTHYGLHASASNVKVYVNTLQAYYATTDPALVAGKPFINHNEHPIIHPNVHELFIDKKFRIGLFAKYEPLQAKLNLCNDKKIKLPRPILTRDPLVNLTAMQFMAAIENYMYKEKIEDSPYLHKLFPNARGRTSTKGMNSLASAAWVKEKARNFKAMYGVDPVIASLDCEAHDAKVYWKHIRAAVSLMCILMPAHAGYWVSFTKHLINNKGRSRGFSFTRKGTVPTGDAWTSWLTTIIMKSNIITSLQAIRWHKVDFGGNGDDQLLFYHPRHQHKLQELVQQFELSGHKLKVESYSQNLKDLSFCQAHLIPLVTLAGDTVWKFIQHPMKTLATLGSHIHMRDPISARSYLTTQLNALAILNHGVPLMQDIDILVNSFEGNVRTFKMNASSNLLNSLIKEDLIELGSVDLVNKSNRVQKYVRQHPLTDEWFERLVPRADQDALFAEWKATPVDWIEQSYKTNPHNVITMN